MSGLWNEMGETSEIRSSIGWLVGPITLVERKIRLFEANLCERERLLIPAIPS
ncbi:uncharacterized protein METZ01_LOCUS264661 [marine metagenome]|uniref:Uncharacterized protein n=1 Tax=marine metagenome TaxID=408172 RepID=A0A382JL27_9ZZZZ